MQAYLAEKYMSGPKADAILSRKAPKKKKKKSKPNDAAGPTSGGGGGGASSSSMIVDDDAGWDNAVPPTAIEDGDADDDDDAVVASDRAFKKRRVAPGAGDADDDGNAGGSGWTTVREPTPPLAADEQPVVVAMTEDEAPPPPTAVRGGLFTKEDLRARLPTSAPQNRRKDEEGEGEGEGDEDAEALAAAQETVYRDASGRKIDMKVEKAEAARKKREREEREAQKMEWGKGLVQREDVEKRRREEEHIRLSGFTRYADDEELNRTQKDQDRWNDPAAAFMTKKRTKGPRKPEYSGPPPPPNRFGIKPGYRWDGVDRGNGFEKKYFQKHNERRRTGMRSHEWSVEDM